MSKMHLDENFRITSKTKYDAMRCLEEKQNEDLPPLDCAGYTTAIDKRKQRVDELTKE